MATYFQVSVQQHKPKERAIINALLAISTGVLTLIYPNFLYLIAGGYLVALGLLFLFFRTPAIIAALPMVTGAIIFIFPEIIPVAFAAFLALFGFILLFSFHFTLMGVLTMVIALLIIANPDSVAYLIAAFLLLYGISSFIRFFRNRKGGSNDDEIEEAQIIDN